MKLSLHCIFCHAAEEFEVEVAGWRTKRGAGPFYLEEQLCAKHAGAAQWMDDQCPGCMHGFSEGGNCGVYAGIADLESKQPLTEFDFYSIAAGKCPRRINGTFEITLNGHRPPSFEQVDWSEPSEAGQAMCAALKDSIEWLKDAMARRPR